MEKRIEIIKMFKKVQKNETRNLSKSIHKFKYIDKTPMFNDHTQVFLFMNDDLYHHS